VNDVIKASFGTKSTAAALVLFLALTGSTSSQTASAVTPETFQPPLQKLNGTLVFTGEAGTQAPPGSEAIGITLSDVTIEGALPALAEANDTFRRRLTSGRVPVSELFDATAALEEAYANAGLVLMRVVLPQQSLRDGGVLRVSVVNGFVETVDNAAVPTSVRPRVDALTVPLVDRAGITLKELERQLLLAGDVAGVALSTALAAGERPGGAVLALDAQFRRLTGFVGFDNFPTKDLGRPTVNLGLELNSALNLGETIYGRLSAAPEGVLTDQPQYRVSAIGALFPIGSSGLTFNAEATSSRTNPDSDLFPTQSAFDRQSLRLIYPVIRSRDVNFSTQVALDHQTDQQDLIGSTSAVAIYRDEVTVLRAGASSSYQHSETAMTEVGITLSRGLGLFGARKGDATPLSRQGADPVFSKLNASFRHQRALGEKYSLSISGQAQSSFGDALVTSEQFGIVGASDLSTFDSGSLRGDSGYVFRSELTMPIQTELAGRSAVFAPDIFAGFGAVSNAQPTALEQKTLHASSFGIGFNLLLQGNSPFRADTIRVEYGKGNRDDGDNENRFSISGNIRF
jgi:hemolysin activation/secretion protein